MSMDVSFHLNQTYLLTRQEDNLRKDDELSTMTICRLATIWKVVCFVF